MSCPQVAAQSAAADSLLRLRARPLRIALVGNPNVGKSVLFGRLTGKYAVVSNYPGTTVAVTQGRAVVGAEVCDVIDTPGVNALEGVLSEDEVVTRDIVGKGAIDLVVPVIDARNLRRGLMLVSQIAAFQKPLVVALNMIDEARSHGITVDAAGLAEHLGVPVVETVATEGRGLPELRQELNRPEPRALPVDQHRRHVEWAHETAERYRTVRRRSAARFQERLGRLTREPLTGLPILALVLYVVYLFVGVFGAQTLVELLEDGLFQTYVNPAVAALMAPLPWAPVREFVVGEYGIVTMGLTYAIAIVLPVVSTFFLIFGALEDSGYIPRLAIFSDRVFRAMGLNGKAVLPMVLGLGCDTMATMTTRILGTSKERLIAVLLLALGVPCSAQLATILGILGGISVGALITLFGVVILQMFFVGFLAARALPGERSEFILELPPIRMPLWGNVIRKTQLRIRWYLGEAVPLFLAGTVILFVLDRTGGLTWLIRTTAPVVQGWLGLPAEASAVFVMGFLRRDYGAAGLFHMSQQGQLAPVQAVVALTVMTLFVPCVAHFLMIVKEQGLKPALGILGVVTVVALATGGVLNAGLRALGVEF